MIRPGISRQLLLAGTIPAAVVTVIVGVWLVSLRVSDMRVHQVELGEAVAAQLAPAAEYGVFSGNTAVLQRLAEVALEEADIRAVTIHDRVGVELAQALKEGGAGAESSAPARWLTARFIDPDATLRFTAPIVQPLTDLGEFDLPELRADEAVIGSVAIEIAVLPGFARQVDALLTGAAILLGGLLVSLLLAGRLGERIAGPIQRLADAMRRVRDGDLDVRVPESSTTELGQLESGLNKMADEVQRTQRTLEERIARATADLQETVGALEVSNVELDLARRRALEASHSKSEFLAAMSHEIRTPMSGIIGFADLLARTGLSTEQLEQVLTIRTSADSLMRILNDILDLSRIEAGKMLLGDEPFDVRACIDEAVSLMAPLAYAKRLALHRRVDREVPRMLRGDPMRIRQIVTNLVSNAIKYTNAGSVSLEATLASTTGSPELRIRVADTGVGIDPEVQHQLFQAFSQPTPTTAHYPGAGLGLVICNQLVEAMGGEIELDSAPGTGSVFTVSLQLQHAPAPSAPPRWNGLAAVAADSEPLTRDHIAQLLEFDGFTVTQVDHAGLADAPRTDLLVIGVPDVEATDLSQLADHSTGFGAVIALADTHDEAWSEWARTTLGAHCQPRCSSPAALRRTLANALDGAVPPAAHPAQSLASVSALVVDDNRVNRALLCRQLEAAGATVASAKGGAEAVTQCSSAAYDVVLLDLHMPGIDGVEAARLLNDVARPPLVIAVTANAQPVVQRNPHAAGFGAVLLKPVAEQVLTQTVADELERRQRAREAAAALDAEILQMLAEDLPAHARSFYAAALTNDRHALRAEAHALRGIAAVCRIAPLADALARLEAVPVEQPVPESVLDEAGAELLALVSTLTPTE
ncbi:MAG: ATP-binding protein [Gammaproteobacteria bacterium]